MPPPLPQVVSPAPFLTTPSASPAPFLAHSPNDPAEIQILEVLDQIFGEEKFWKTYTVKWIRFDGSADDEKGIGMRPIILDGEDAPGSSCLLSLMNVLYINKQICRLRGRQWRHTRELMRNLLERIRELQNLTGSMSPLEVHDWLSLPHSLDTYLASVKGIATDSNDWIVFQTLNIPLYHGRILHNNDESVKKLIQEKSCEQLEHFSSDSNSLEFDQQAFVPVGKFLADTHKNQLTPAGVHQLMEEMEENQVAVLYLGPENYKVVHKRGPAVYILVTGFDMRNNQQAIWRHLDTAGMDLNEGMDIARCPLYNYKFKKVEGQVPAYCDMTTVIKTQGFQCVVTE